ncbi:Class I SAM-dependent methyltransferase [Sulfidibacter corallicola]|uniref:Class I SAM-dependent methyltransferase n=1 Tax=Sulfidibacter corallicola TaxID=2818388 RepID=A0A8A4TPZ1_SULCO|nr:class I SAM-dependent methyltransferase [Sulfidibacter corallicola]QTD50981.1 class I SAM-dependent methyltransferase [Sulfidibacter corallicola]
MSLVSDLKVLYSLTLAPVKGKDHAERMEGFYSRQADDYDSFRDRLLKGRRDIFHAIKIPKDGVWIDFGGGTGSNMEYLGSGIDLLKKFYVVDLSPSLLNVARQRTEEHGWTNVEAVLGDATRFVPAEEQVDVITFSYSLTMIPNWFAALDHALRLLKPGGTIAVVDFYVSRKSPDEGMVFHPWWSRAFWRTWFDFDHVFPSPDHVPYLQHRFEPLMFREYRAKVPYLPFARVPYYVFMGRMPG